MTDDSKLPLATPNPADDLLAQLREAAPQIFSEGRIDLDKFKAALGEHIDPRIERYGLNWAGKSDAFRNVQQPSVGTLLPQPDESVNWDSTENLIIEGDNLEVLKLLQKPYHGKVKMIYIDPPYNTGNEFIYPDNYREGLDDYLRYSGQVSEEGVKQSTNTETSGRFHSNWLNMMYPRLFLARNLLRDDGVIFVSIDDNEVHNLRMLMNEVFGEENFVAQLTWEGAFKNDARQVGISHEYVVVFARSRTMLSAQWTIAKAGVDRVLNEVDRLRTTHGDDYETASLGLAAWFRDNKATPSFSLRRFRFIDKNGVYKEDDPTAPGGRKFDLVNPNTGQIIPLRANRGWAFDQAGFEKLVREGRITFVTDRSIMVRRYLHETDRMTPQSVFYQPARSASERLGHMMGDSVFDFPKDETVIAQFVEMATSVGDQDAIIVDFFAGSGTTAQSVLELNREDGGNRKFILVQLPEKTDNLQYPTIAHITRERVRRVIAKLNRAGEGQLNLAGNAKPDRGFRAFKLSSSNFKIWDAAQASTEPDQLALQLQHYTDNVDDSRSQQDILYELILKAGLPLAAKVEQITVEGKPVFSVAEGQLLICLENPITQDVLRGMMAREPLQILCLDTAFRGNDPLKTNAVLEAQSHGITFRTV